MTAPGDQQCGPAKSETPPATNRIELANGEAEQKAGEQHMGMDSGVQRPIPSVETSRLLAIEQSRQCAKSLAEGAEGALWFAEVPVSSKEGAELMTAPTAFAVHLVMLGFRIPA